ncbi:MAG: thiamine phosphate synthase [Clostridia bacterium]|nr:thiamine phosphate synthase [Clostridia bacterium]
MYDIICVTDRKNCEGDFLAKIEEIAAAEPDSIILREKNLSENEYRCLAESVLKICRKYSVPCTLHSFYAVAAELGAKRLHLPLPVMRELDKTVKQQFEVIGVSCHSAEEAIEAQKLGAGYITAGHIFATDCKAGLPGRGLSFLKDVCSAVEIPVYAIGGISGDNIAQVIQSGADGVCIMSGFMKCENTEMLVRELKGGN